MPKALITGITGQDGSYLADFLLDKGYEVHGIIRRSSSFNTARIDHIFDRLHLHYGDVMDQASLAAAIKASKPDEIYNLAAQSHVKTSFDMPIYSAEVAAIGALNVFEAARSHARNARIYQASSSEMFGNAPAPQREQTRFEPRSPYACAKVFAYYQAINYRQSYNMFIANGILFNHESPRRGETFVTRKITRAATRIKLGLQDRLKLGNIHSIRDWGFAGDYVKAMWLMLQHPIPDDFVIGTGKAYSVANFLSLVFSSLELDWLDYTDFGEARYLRPSEVTNLQADPARASSVLRWRAETEIESLAAMMVEHDLKLAEEEAAVKAVRDARC